MVSGVKRSAVLIGVGLAVGLALVVYGVHRITSPRPRAAAPEVAVQRARVATAAHPIARGVRIEASDLVMTELPGAAPGGAFTAAGSVVGRVAAFDIPARQIVLGSALASTASLAAQVPVGYRAISIQTNEEIAVSDLLRPGDIVDVQLVLGDALLSKGATGPVADRSQSNTLLQAVRVVSVGDLIGPSSADDIHPPGPQAQPRRTMTLAMTPDQVAQFTLARNLGSFFLALRNPADRQEAPRSLARLTDIRLGGDAPAPARPAAAPVRVARVRSGGEAGVELVVGDQSQVIYPQ